MVRIFYDGKEIRHRLSHFKIFDYLGLNTQGCARFAGILSFQVNSQKLGVQAPQNVEFE